MDQFRRGHAVSSGSQELLALTEQRLYFAILHSRFTDDAGWTHQVDAVKAALPWFLRFLTGMIRRSQIKKTAANGVGDGEDGYVNAVSDVARITEVLADQPFLLGDSPHIVDCSVWAHLLQASHTRSPNPLTDAVRAAPTLMAYIERVNERLKFDVPPPPSVTSPPEG